MAEQKWKPDRHPIKQHNRKSVKPREKLVDAKIVSL